MHPHIKDSCCPLSRHHHPHATASFATLTCYTVTLQPHATASYCQRLDVAGETVVVLEDSTCRLEQVVGDQALHRIHLIQHAAPVAWGWVKGRTGRTSVRISVDVRRLFSWSTTRADFSKSSGARPRGASIPSSMPRQLPAGREDVRRVGHTGAHQVWDPG